MSLCRSCMVSPTMYCDTHCIIVDTYPYTHTKNTNYKMNVSLSVHKATVMQDLERFAQDLNKGNT